ncbi:MAG: hypothetical protein HC880_00245 [Bacteroidia bacterium]|nr:hypothetical protein [Bacteroidia bacterium]
MKFNWNWVTGRQATGPLQKDEDKTIFGFIFAHLEVFLLIGMGFMIYALFNTFTQFVADHALFIHEPDRWSFARTLIFGLMGVEVLLALAITLVAFAVNLPHLGSVDLENFSGLKAL